MFNAAVEWTETDQTLSLQPTLRLIEKQPSQLLAIGQPRVRVRAFDPLDENFRRVGLRRFRFPGAPNRADADNAIAVMSCVTVLGMVASVHDSAAQTRPIRHYAM
jgi:hypothetical protein